MYLYLSGSSREAGDRNEGIRLEVFKCWLKMYLCIYLAAVDEGGDGNEGI